MTAFADGRFASELLRAVVGCASDAILVIDEAQHILVFNHAAERMFGCAAAEAIGQPLGRFLPARLREAHRGHVEDFTREGAGTRAMRPARELVACRADGSEFPIEGSISLADVGGRRLMTAIVRDISERRALEAARLASSAAVAANEARSRFLSRMSHELRTPLNAIIGFASLLRMEDTPALAEHQIEYAKAIEMAGQHLNEMIGEMLDLARSDLGAFDVTLAPVAIGPVIDDALALVARLARDHGVDCHAETGIHGATRVRADRTRLLQVLANLLTNAIKYNRPGGRVRVTVAGAGDPPRLDLVIADTGIGIPAGRMGELFEPFNRLGRERSGIDGAGIGLALSRKLVEMMGGALTVESEEGAGTTVTVGLDPCPADPVADGCLG
ncbi:PAS domain-containing sensor histidine kinase [Derxia gummosa]|uniref:histidine kinase n=1 Tax=Derxia gummosa DSM 723 TaxID=1121388 RepID=A0A8B6X903_9BURK|nr:PAS domain-containing sensor histidine kinase [Derxia gummosa]